MINNILWKEYRKVSKVSKKVKLTKYEVVIVIEIPIVISEVIFGVETELIIPTKCLEFYCTAQRKIEFLKLLTVTEKQE